MTVSTPIWRGRMPTRTNRRLEMLLDTSGLMCLFDQDDARYADAQILFDVASAKLTRRPIIILSKLVLSACGRHE